MASREPDLYKDKIEVNLDGRQIFYLFFGGSVIVGMVFVLGVMVGRRVEARGHLDRAHTAANVDPLAALDRLEGSGGLTFQGTLAGAAPAAADVEQTISAIAAKKNPPVVAAPAAPVVAVKKDEPKADKPKDKDKDKDVEAKADKPKDKDKDVEAKADKPKDKDKDKDKDVEAKADKPKDKDKDKDKEDHARYTLQLSSFQDKGEAQAFLDNLKSAGYQATLTEAEVDGKGTFYRIRYGTYRSLDAASDAKSEIEKAAHKSASIMKL